MKRKESATVFPEMGPLESVGNVAETSRNSDRLADLTAAIDGSGIPRKQIAGMLGKSEGELSKLLGSEERFTVALLDKLPAEIRRDFIRRTAARDGMETHLQTPAELMAGLVEAIDKLATMARLVKQRVPLKADLATAADRSQRRVG